MKKLVCTMLLATLLASFAVSAVMGASAANTPPDMDVIYDIYYGKAVVDGVKDEAYFADPSTKSYVHNATYDDPSFVYPEGKETSFECWLLWDESSLYGFMEVTDYTPVTYSFKNYKTDCIELNFLLVDRASYAGKGTSMYSDVESPGVGMFRVSNPDGYTASNLYELLPQKGGLAVWDELYGLSKCVTTKTDKGYNVEFSIKIPDEIVHLVCTPGAHVGFGIQCNDDANDNSVRDAIIYSANLNDQHGKTGEYILLDKNGVRPDAPVSREPAATSSPETTAAKPEATTEATDVTTKVQDVTTKAPVTDASPAATDGKQPETSATEGSNGGCGSSSAVAAVLVATAAGCALAVRRRR